MGIVPVKKSVPAPSMEVQYFFTQTSDALDDNEDQECVVKTMNSKGTKFFVLSSKRWAFNNINEVVSILKESGVPNGLQ